MYLSVVLIYGGLWLSVGFWDMLKYHGVPAAIAMLTGSFIITIQHANSRSLVYTADGWDPARSQMASTFDVRFPKWVEYLWCNINIHIPHHVAPEIPWYHLPESARILFRRSARHVSWRAVSAWDTSSSSGKRRFSNRSRARAISSWIRPAESDAGASSIRLPFVVPLPSFRHPFRRSIERLP